MGVPTTGPGSCEASALCAGTVLDGNYPNTDTSLVTPSIALPIIDVANEGIFLSYQHWFSFATHTNGNDTGGIYVQPETAPGVWGDLTFVSNLSGTSGGWTSNTVDLSGFADNKIRIHFRLVNNVWSGVGAGWFIDDVSVSIF